jgi:hypothetical protein
MTEIIPYGGYVCTWFCDDMTANEVPYVLGFFRITPSNDGTGDVMSSYGRMTVAGVRQLATFFVSANGINAIFKRMVGTHFALVQTKCNLIP